MFPESGADRGARRQTAPTVFAPAKSGWPPGKLRRWPNSCAGFPNACGAFERERLPAPWAAAPVTLVPIVLLIPGGVATAWTLPPGPAVPIADKVDPRIGAE